MEGLIVILLLAAALFWFVSEPRQDYDVGRIKRGMTKQEVIAIFGKPHNIRDGLCGKNWVWTVPWKIYASVTFSGDRVTDTYRSGPPCKGDI